MELDAANLKILYRPHELVAPSCFCKRHQSRSQANCLHLLLKLDDSEKKLTNPEIKAHRKKFFMYHINVNLAHETTLITLM